jgi:hypothetical protein
MLKLQKKLIFIIDFLLLILIVIGIISCNHITGPTTISTSSSYFPLQVGNEWHYDRLESRPFIICITSKKNIAGMMYFERTSSENQFSETLREKNRVIYRRIEGKEYAYMDFNRSIGEKWQESPHQRYAYIASCNDTISVRAGTFVDCIRIVRESDLDKTETWYAPGVGMVASNVEAKKNIIICGSCQLNSAIITGKSIP